MTPDLRLLSLGAGVQSTTLALMAAAGELDRLDGAIFADTGWEPAAVYAHLDRLAEVLAAADIPLYRVSQGNLRNDSINPTHRFASIPYFILNPDGSEGMGRRQCTSEYKLAPINREVRRLLGAPGPEFKRVPGGRVAEQWIGFSTDEVSRIPGGVPDEEWETPSLLGEAEAPKRPARRRFVSYQQPRYPLIELGMDRDACTRWLAARGWTTVQKSACIGCPYHNERSWRQLRDERPDEWADAVDFDRRIRKGGARAEPLLGEAFLHRRRLPLSVAVSSASPDDDQPRLFDGDGCSPYGCRSGSPVAEEA